MSSRLQRCVHLGYANSRGARFRSPKSVVSADCDTRVRAFARNSRRALKPGELFPVARVSSVNCESAARAASLLRARVFDIAASPRLPRPKLYAQLPPVPEAVVKPSHQVVKVFERLSARQPGHGESVADMVTRIRLDQSLASCAPSTGLSIATLRAKAQVRAAATCTYRPLLLRQGSGGGGLNDQSAAWGF